MIHKRTIYQQEIACSIFYHHIHSLLFSNKTVFILTSLYILKSHTKLNYRLYEWFTPIINLISKVVLACS